MSDFTLKTDFSRSEMSCRCGANCGAKVADSAIVALQALRERVGVPMVVTSSIRCADHNKAIGGMIASKHLEGIAFDVEASPILKGLILRVAGDFGFNGIGVYDWGIHIDRRDTPVVWSG